MRVFVAGASGAIGRSLLPQLIAAGHEVTGMTRSQERAAAIEAAGAKALVADVYDRDRVVAAVMEAGTEVLIHQLTALPKALDLRKKGIYEATNRVRREGTAILIDAAKAAGARRIVAQSISFVYEPEGDWVKDESAPVMRSAPGEFGTASAATFDLERQVLESGLEAIVLRYAFFYGPGTAYASDGYFAEEAHRRRLPVIRGAQGRTSFIHIGDAAAATVAAARRGASGIYNVADDEPATMDQWAPAFSAAVGAPKPLRVPKLIARILAGKDIVGFADTLRGASNAKAKAELGWQPAYPSWRQGFAAGL